MDNVITVPEVLQSEIDNFVNRAVPGKYYLADLRGNFNKIYRKWPLKVFKKGFVDISFSVHMDKKGLYVDLTKETKLIDRVNPYLSPFDYYVNPDNEEEIIYVLFREQVGDDQFKITYKTYARNFWGNLSALKNNRTSYMILSRKQCKRYKFCRNIN